MVTTNAPIITLRDVRFTYDGGATWALDGVSLDIRRGERICLTGPNVRANPRCHVSSPDWWLPMRDMSHCQAMWCSTSPRARDEYRTARCGIGAVFQHPEDQIVTTVTEETWRSDRRILRLSMMRSACASPVRWTPWI